VEGSVSGCCLSIKAEALASGAAERRHSYRLVATPHRAVTKKREMV
jgi:hypothetical protein